VTFKCHDVPCMGTCHAFITTGLSCISEIWSFDRCATKGPSILA